MHLSGHPSLFPYYGYLLALYGIWEMNFSTNKLPQLKGIAGYCPYITLQWSVIRPLMQIQNFFLLPCLHYLYTQCTLSQCLTLSIVCLHSCLLSVDTTLRVTKLHIIQQHRKLIPSYRPFDPSSADIITTLVTDFTAHQDLPLSYVYYMNFLKYCFYLV